MIHKNVDDKGRVTISKELREKLGLNPDTIVSQSEFFGCLLIQPAKMCDKCAGKKKESKEKAAMQAFLEQMPVEFRKAALECLLEKGGESG